MFHLKAQTCMTFPNLNQTFITLHTLQHSSDGTRDEAKDDNWDVVSDLSGMYSLNENCSPVA